MLHVLLHGRNLGLERHKFSARRHLRLCLEQERLHLYSLDSIAAVGVVVQTPISLDKSGKGAAAAAAAGVDVVGHILQNPGSRDPTKRHPGGDTRGDSSPFEQIIGSRLQDIPQQHPAGYTFAWLVYRL